MTTQSIRPVAVAESLRSHVEKAVASAIVTGELQPGELLSVRALAAQFEVSATPVREAILDLEKRGFVESVRNRGFRVTEVSAADLAAIVEMRQLLEPPTMAKVASGFPSERMPEFRGLADAIIDASDRGDVSDYLTADAEFHLRLLALAGNDRIVSAVAELRSLTRMIRISAIRHTEEFEQSNAEHHLMLDLIAEGNAAKLEKLVRRHVGHAAGIWSGQQE